MLVVDYQSKSYHRFLEDMLQISKHNNRFLITLNGGNRSELEAAKQDLASNAEKPLHSSTVINDKASESSISALFEQIRADRKILCLENSDILFDRKTDLKRSHERDCGFDLNNLFKNMAKHKGIVLLVADQKQTLSASMSTKVDVLVRFPNKD